jgi:hypothetical protein
MDGQNITASASPRRCWARRTKLATAVEMSVASLRGRSSRCGSKVAYEKPNRGAHRHRPIKSARAGCGHEARPCTSRRGDKAGAPGTSRRRKGDRLRPGELTAEPRAFPSHVRVPCYVPFGMRCAASLLGYPAPALSRSIACRSIRSISHCVRSVLRWSVGRAVHWRSSAAEAKDGSVGCVREVRQG